MHLAVSIDERLLPHMALNAPCFAPASPPLTKASTYFLVNQYQLFQK